MAIKSQTWASIFKDHEFHEITVARIGQAKSVLWTFNFQFKKITLFIFLGQVKMSFGQVFFIKFVIYLPEWASKRTKEIQTERQTQTVSK